MQLEVGITKREQIHSIFFYKCVLQFAKAQVTLLLSSVHVVLQHHNTSSC